LVRVDSLTQAVLGAAVAEAGMGRQLGRRAMVWGVALGTLPDLDVLADPLLDTIGELEWHRGISHSLFLITLVSPLLGWAVSKLHKHAVGVRRAILTVWLILFTHVLIDVFTVYGTVIFAPFSEARVGFNNLFIIDPLFTLPLLLGVIAAWILHPRGSSGSFWNAVGLLLASVYALWSFGVKTWADQKFVRAARDHGIEAVQHMTSPTPLNTLLWRGMADDGTFLHIGYVSILRPSAPVRFLVIPKNPGLAPETRPANRLRWFSDDYFSIQNTPDGQLWSDWRFGEVPAASENPQPIFAWLVRHDGDVVPQRPSLNSRSLGAIWQLAQNPVGEAGPEGSVKESGGN
jgi:inner membrane protein